MINEICEWHHRSTGQTPAKASSYNIYECSSKKFVHILMLQHVIDSWKQIWIEVQCLFYQNPLFFVLFFVVQDGNFEDLVLEFCQLIFTPSHWEVSLAYYREIGVIK